MQHETRSPLVFPKWLDSLRPLVAVTLFGVAPVYATVLIWYGGSPRTTDVGYEPEQPVPYSHALHAGQLGIDCRYCHTTVERAAHAAVPPTQTCMNCHSGIRPDSPQLEPVRRSYTSGLPVHWVRVHDLPDYVYFDHSAHVTRGVGCVECHGRVDRMEVVYQVQTLSMGWCLDCHRDPAPHLRPPDQVTNMTWNPAPAERAALAAELIQRRRIHPSEDCSTCHR